jgi:hypothetical protein
MFRKLMTKVCVERSLLLLLPLLTFGLLAAAPPVSQAAGRPKAERRLLAINLPTNFDPLDAQIKDLDSQANYKDPLSAQIKYDPESWAAKKAMLLRFAKTNYETVHANHKDRCPPHLSTTAHFLGNEADYAQTQSDPQYFSKALKHQMPITPKDPVGTMYSYVRTDS